MVDEHIVLCGGARPGRGRTNGAPSEIHLWGAHANAELCVADISRKMVSNLPTVLVDLLEVAAYVYFADQKVARGGQGVLDHGARWRRSFQFFIPVRHPDLWSSSGIRNVLTGTLGFLSDDTYAFHFEQLKRPPAADSYLELVPGSDEPEVDEVALFSGGIDSLGGAIESAVTAGRRIALVSHRSASKMAAKQSALIAALQKHAKYRVQHVTLRANKKGTRPADPNQRSRSFLFASIAMVVAHLFGLKRINFYENGVLSINLPISEQLIGARATRTAHPKALMGFSTLFSELVQEPFLVENPFQWKTKTEVVQQIMASGLSDLIRVSASCVDVQNMSTRQPHCGVCSQCVDRRFAILSAGLAEKDEPADSYRVDLLTGSRTEGEQRTLAASYVRFAKSMRSMDLERFTSEFGAASRAFNQIPGMSAKQAAEAIHALHQRHGNAVWSVIEKGAAEKASDLMNGRLPESAILAMSVPCKYGDRRLEDVLPSGPPRQSEVYCRAVVCEGDGAEARELTRDGYEVLIARAKQFDLFVDGATGMASVNEGPGKQSRTEKLTPTEVSILTEYIERRRALRPTATIAARSKHAVTAQKLFEKVRRKVDTKLGPRSYLWFRSHPAASSFGKAYEFVPPAGRKYCVIRTVVQ